MFRLSTRLSATKWELAALKSLGDKEVAAILKAAAFSASTLPKAVTASIGQIKVGLHM